MDKDVQYIAPQSPFLPFKSPFVDAAWGNNNDGSSISFHTDCEDISQTKLYDVSQQIISDLDESKIIYKKYELFNKNKALRSQVQGLLEGIPTKMEFLIFRKNKCIYILNYISIESNFLKNHSVFHNFQKEFKVP